MSTAPQPAPAGASHLDELYEFDREPIPQEKLLGPAHFIGSFSGEHVAATEFVIGVTFVNWGASLGDIFVGLAIGNLLAVLTWTLLCAPIAVQTRLTLYWYLRKIAGRGFCLIYNTINALMFCVLAGCMITVSASAVRIPFGIPAQVEWYPTDFRFVLVTLFVGAVVVALAILGFEKLAEFATICAPWMLLMFVCGAFATLPALFASSDANGFWELGRTAIWTGTTPDGSEPMGFWKITAFAWICNLAMHGGLSDMALFRYARHSYYGLYSAFGMYLGHYLAWICAGMMGAGAAILAGQSLATLDSGEVGYQALGWAGAIAVVIAGWTTSNPTLYRAGLALQAITPNWSRVRVTLVAGAITTVIACFPFVFTGLLDFIGLYGLLLSPAGAIVVTEHWLFPRLGMRQFWASGLDRWINAPALVSWGIGMAAALGLERSGTLHLFYLFLPVYVLTSISYILLVKMFAGNEKPAPAPDEVRTSTPAPEAPKKPRSAATLWLAGCAAAAALLACLTLSIEVADSSSAAYAEKLAEFKSSLLIPTLIYFVAGTVFLRHYRSSSSNSAKTG